MTDEMIEAVAKAIAAPVMRKFDGWHPNDPVEWERISENDRAGLMAIARAAIEAMTIPILDMDQLGSK
jgi:hypothetical protein